jgi:hypothetical protein
MPKKGERTMSDAEEPTITLGKAEYWLLYGTGCKLICLSVTVVDHVLTLVFRVVDAHNDKKEAGVQGNGQETP